MKQCTICKKNKELADFSKGKTKDGFQYRCKQCYSIYRTENKSKIAAQKAIHYQKNREDLLNRQNKYYDENKEAENARSSAYYENHKEELTIYKSIHHKKNYAKNKEKLSKKGRDYRINNKEKNANRNFRWKKENPGKVAFHRAQRRAIKLLATPKWLTKAQKKEMQAIYVECARLTKETGIKHHVDHIIPLQAIDENGHRVASGLHLPWNLRIVTASQNCSDGAKLINKL